jgi:RES domain-containing protein
VWAHRPLSGEGAALHGGRFNPKGWPALYLSLDPLTAIREANQVGHLQPTTLVAYRASIERMFPGDDPSALSEFELTLQDIAENGWRDAMQQGGEAPTQKLARTLVNRGYQALLTPSFARGAQPEDRNLVLWLWGAHPAHLVPIDDERRLKN